MFNLDFPLLLVVVIGWILRLYPVSFDGFFGYILHPICLIYLSHHEKYGFEV